MDSIVDISDALNYQHLQSFTDFCYYFYSKNNLQFFIHFASWSFLWQNRMISGNGKWPEEDWVIAKKEKENPKTWYFMNQKISSRISKWNLFRVVLSSYAAFNIFHPSCSAILQLLASITQWSTNKTSSPFLCFTYVWMILRVSLYTLFRIICFNT